LRQEREQQQTGEKLRMSETLFREEVAHVQERKLYHAGTEFAQTSFLNAVLR
jgi:hypothetical protein